MLAQFSPCEFPVSQWRELAERAPQQMSCCQHHVGYSSTKFSWGAGQSLLLSTSPQVRIATQLNPTQLACSQHRYLYVANRPFWIHYDRTLSHPHRASERVLHVMSGCHQRLMHARRSNSLTDEVFQLEVRPVKKYRLRATTHKGLMSSALNPTAFAYQLPIYIWIYWKDDH